LPFAAIPLFLPAMADNVLGGKEALKVWTLVFSAMLSAVAGNFNLFLFLM